MTNASPLPTTSQVRRIPLHVYGVLLVGMMSISFAPILVRLAQGENVPSLIIAASRLILAAAILTPVVLRRHWSHIRNLTRRDLSFAVAAGLFLAFHFAAWITSLEYTSVLLSTVFVTSSPIWVAILETLFLRARLPRLVIIGLIVAVTGGLLIGFAGQLNTDENIIVDQQRELIGGALSLVGALAVSAYFVIGRKLRASLPVLPYAWLVYGIAGITLTIVALLSGIPFTGYSGLAYLWIVSMAIFPQLLGHSSLNYAVEFLPATLVTMVVQVEPIGSALLAFLIFSEVPLPLQIVGSAIILLGVMLANIGQLRQKPS